MAQPSGTLLIANRGEIAWRILRTARRLGLRTVVPHSEADRQTLGALNADLAISLGAGSVAETYLDMEKLVQIARETGAQAVHPGYGLLSESSLFARKVREAGLIWVGPPPEAMEKVADKARARQLAREAQVPTVPGHEGAQVLDEFAAAAGRLGYPVVLKATAGGGGRGIRVVADETALRTQWEQARAEARGAFGSDEMLLEKYVPAARHIEVQLACDALGKVLHLGERDCSTQRRRQKLLEEAPAPNLDAGLRERICEAGKRLAKAANYVNFGTAEFLVTPHAEFYFLEINARLQVEHPVTEAVTGLDLVEWQLRVAWGESLPFEQETLRMNGHAIEARLCAEDPYEGFRPQTGRVGDFRFPEAARVDHFLTPHSAVTALYDSMVAKLIVHAPSREEARLKLAAALDATLVSGLRTNRRFLRQLVESPFFREGKTLIQSLENETWTRPPRSPGARESAARWAARELAATPGARGSPYGSWSSAPGRESWFCLRDEAGSIRVRPDGEAAPAPAPTATVVESGRVHLIRDGEEYAFHDELAEPRATSMRSQTPDQVTAPMDAVVTQVLARPGETVREGQLLLVLEAMKMQMELRSPLEGRVKALHVAQGHQVRNRQSLLELEQAAAKPQE